VIVTAFDRHAIQVFDAGAVDYLRKPVGEARLRTAERARALVGKPAEIASRIDQVASAQPGGAPDPPSPPLVARPLGSGRSWAKSA
jgi:two-component system LytT family response regulator